MYVHQKAAGPQKDPGRAIAVFYNEQIPQFVNKNLCIDITLFFCP